MIRVLSLFFCLLAASVTQAASIFVSVPPLVPVLKALDTDNQVESLVTAGYSPATYSPTPRQLVALSNANIFVRSGLPYEAAWMSRIKAVNPSILIVDLRDGVDLLEHHHHHHEGHDEHEDTDPHLWTDPVLIANQLDKLAQALIKLTPDREQVIVKNYLRYQQQLLGIDNQIRTLLAPYANNTFYVYHPAWSYFAKRYQLNQVSLERGGKDFGPHALEHVLEASRHNAHRVLFVQPQFDRRLAQRVADEIHGYVVTIDPLSEAYPSNLLDAATALKKVFSHE
jgi:zinc transport system substrate-binding protein